MMKLRWISRHAGTTDGVPLRNVVMYGTLSHELNGPWSPDSRTQLARRFPTISSPPPMPSLKLMPARGLRTRGPDHRSS
jgi:hypothetical protein